MKRATVYFDPDIHKALRRKALEVDQSISCIVNEAVRIALDEDLEDLTDIQLRKREKTISYETFLKELKSRGRI